MTNAANLLVSTRPTGALTRQLVAMAAAESAGRFAVICREQAIHDVARLEEALMDLLGIPGTTAATLDIVAAAIGAHRR